MSLVGPAPPFLRWALDLAAVCFILAVLLLSLLSISFILHLRLRLRFRPNATDPLHGLNSLWTVRLLLVASVALWALAEFLRLPILLRRSIRQPWGLRPAALCRAHSVLSLGLLEPAFLLTILFLVNASVRQRSPGDVRSAALVLLTCLPVFLLQLLATVSPLHRLPLPAVFHQNHVISRHPSGHRTFHCTTPLLSACIFGAFAAAYSLCLLLSSCRAASAVINKGLRRRIFVLASTVMTSLWNQVVFLGLSAMWRLDEGSGGAAALVVFLSALSCAVAGQGILVIKPIADALAADGIHAFRLCGETGRGGDGVGG